MSVPDTLSVTIPGPLKLVSAFDRDTGSVVVFGDRILSQVNFDEHGSEGEAVQESFAEALAQALGLELMREELANDEYRAMLDELEEAD